jgi:hypothetical protein
MSVEQNVYLGPYAEWLVRVDEITDEFQELAEGILQTNAGMDLPPVVKVKRKEYHRFCFMPGESRGREPHWSIHDGDGIEDLRGIDMKAEIDWFATAFAVELGAVAEHLGRSPTLHWGIVGWMA